MGVSTVFNLKVVCQNLLSVQDVEVFIGYRMLSVNICQLSKLVCAQIMLRKNLMLELSDGASSKSNRINDFSPCTVVVSHPVGRVAQDKGVVF